MGFPLQEEPERYAEYREQLNIKTRGLKAVVGDNLWQELVKSFDSNPLKICQIKCKNR